MNKIDLESKLKTTKNLDPYRAFMDINLLDLAQVLSKILDDPVQNTLILEHAVYRENILSTAQYIFTRHLSERKEQVPSPHSMLKNHKPQFFSPKSLKTLYSFAA